VADIGKQRLIHQLHQHFNIPEELATALTGQLTADDQNALARFSKGFKAEDWFAILFSELPWTVLLHGLEQNQLPVASKSQYQVTDFLVLAETTSLAHVPLIVEVKRVAAKKRSLSIRSNQALLSEQYSEKIGIPLLYATYWDGFGVWTVNTPDSFEQKSSRRKLEMLRALELDCSGAFGDVSYLISPPITRTLTFSAKRDIAKAQHRKHGTLQTDLVTKGDHQIELELMQSAAFDAIFEMKESDVSKVGDTTTVSEFLHNTCLLKLSWWVSRHLAMFGALPEPKYVNMSMYMIAELTEQLGIPYVHMFPPPVTPQIAQLQRIVIDA
jgi:hypothetical protein